MAGSRFEVYGLSVLSAVHFPHAIECDRPVDVTIDFGTVPDSLSNAVEGVRWQASSREALITIPGVGRFHIQDGSTITIAPDPRVTDSLLLLGLLGSAFGPLLHQRGRFLLHASAVTVGRHAIAFAGHSGLGKSTLALALVRAGGTLITDDLCPLEPTLTPGSVLVTSGLPCLSLWRDALSQFSLTPDPLSRVRPSLEKFLQPIQQDVVVSPQRLRAVVVLSGQEGSPHDGLLRRITGREAFALLQTQTRGLRIARASQGTQHFLLVSAVAASVPVFILDRSRRGFAGLDDTVREIQTESWT